MSRAPAIYMSHAPGPATFLFLKAQQMANYHKPAGADATKILSRAEMQLVLADLRRKLPGSPNARLNLVLFRLAACCGLRVSEIASLTLADVRTEHARPHLRIRRGAAKGGRPRTVPLWWDKGTLDDLAAWKAERVQRGANAGDPYLVPGKSTKAGVTFSRHTLRKRFRTACKALGAIRLEGLTIHHGRHTFISHALAGGRTLAEVRDAAGHQNVSITSTYLHVAVEDEGVGQLFG